MPVMLVTLALLFMLALPPKLGGKPAPPRIVNIRLYAPHRGQKRIHKSKKRFRVVACGRRYGKTLLACNEIVAFALEHPNSNCAWVAPWFRQSKIAYRLIRKAFAKSGNQVITYKSDSDLRLEFANGSVIQFYSAENHDSIRGEGFHFVVVDEAGDTFREPAVWFDSIRAALSDTNGKALIIGTPKGRNLFFTLFARGEDAEYPEWESFHAPTADNPFIPAREIEAAKQELPEDSFEQEYLAVFREDGAGVFRGIDACITGTLDPDYERVKGHMYVLGFDPAKYQDYSVATLIDCHTKQVVGWLRINQIDYTVQLEMVATLAAKYGAHVLMDMTGVGDPLLEQLQALAGQRGFTAEGYLFTNASKKALIESLQLGIQNRDISFPDIPVLVNELRIFEYVMTKARQLSYSAPKGAHDDAVISLALAYMLAKQPRGPLMWSVSDEDNRRTNEMPEFPENDPKTLMVIERWNDDEEWPESPDERYRARDSRRSITQTRRSKTAKADRARHALRCIQGGGIDDYRHTDHEKVIDARERFTYHGGNKPTERHTVTTTVKPLRFSKHESGIYAGTKDSRKTDRDEGRRGQGTLHRAKDSRRRSLLCGGSQIVQTLWRRVRCHTSQRTAENKAGIQRAA